MQDSISPDYINKHILIFRSVYIRLHQLSWPITTGWKASSHPLTFILLVYLALAPLTRLDSTGGRSSLLFPHRQDAVQANSSELGLGRPFSANNKLQLLTSQFHLFL